MSHDRIYHRLAVSLAKELTLGYLRTSSQNFITLQTLIFETKIKEFGDFLSMRPQNSVWKWVASKQIYSLAQYFAI